MTRLPIFPALLVAFSLVAQTAPKPDAPRLDIPKVDAPKGPASKKVDASHLTLQEAIETASERLLREGAAALNIPVPRPTMAEAKAR